MRRRHPKKDVEKALQYAEQRGWQVVLGGAHHWGVIRCGFGCEEPVWSIPANPGNHAKKLVRKVTKCRHRTSG